MLSLPRFASALLTSLLIAAPAVAEIEVHDAFVRATPPGANVTAAFMRLHNTGSETVTLIGASADKAPVVELHTHTEHGGTMQMRPVDTIEIQGHRDHHLKSGGDHLMLMNLPEPLAEGDSVELTLQFSFGEPVLVSVPVLSPESEMELEIKIHSH